MKNNNPVLKSASTYVFELLKEKLSGDYVFHNYQHTVETVKACKELSVAYDLTSRDFEILMLAAWFHDTGYTRAYEGHEEHSIQILKDYLEGEYKLEDIAEIESLILSTKYGHVPDGTLQEILHDADYINLGKKKASQRGELLRIEWEKILGKKYSNIEWAELQLDFILNTTFKTEEAIKTYDERRQQNIREQYDIIDQLKKDETKYLSKLNKGAGEKSPKLGRGIETLYRTIYSYHINLSSIADNKAHIMININTIIISLIITLFGSGYTFSSSNQELFTSIRFVFPMGFLLISSLLSVVFAILSARPNINAQEDYDIKSDTSSVLFFGNFTQLKLKEFVGKIKELKSEQDGLYDSMSVDVYHLGGVLIKKYKLLRWSYNIFMIGLIICAVGFITIVIISMSSGG
ncbi:HD domain-containing protein [Pedobacter sp. HMF7647]|uniref:HD domain-containing protein n=1 Tax=Hufsiella arboris TaxID=2695275 RepID=A0A7K1YF20_9SPHI|nr:Pycsar system effector family protein [Hufsiella arboris]MXV53195.1 HD domain-containing protein [Hufsiella arboris]